MHSSQFPAGLPRLAGDVSEPRDEGLWVAGLAIEAYGARMGIRVNDRSLLDAVFDHLPPTWQRVDEPSPVVGKMFSLVREEPAGTTVYWDDMPLARDLPVDVAVHLFESRAAIYLSQASPQFAFVHAGSVGWRGHAIIVPGAPMAGKTTLVIELVRAGALYLSDEYAVLDSGGLVHPYARRLGIRNGEGVFSEQRHIGELGGTRATDPVPLGLVVLTEYQRDGVWKPEELSAGVGALRLLPHTLGFRERPELCLRALEGALVRARVVATPRGDARSAAQAILDLDFRKQAR